MRKNSVALTLAILGIGFSSVSARAEEAKIAIVDMQKALVSVEAGKTAKAQLEKEFEAKKKEIQNEESSIKRMDEEFKKQSLVMSDEARARKQAEIQDRVMKLQEMTAKSQMDIQQKEKDLTMPIFNRMRAIIGDMAKQKGYTVVLDKNENMVLYSVERDDITDAVINAYNKNPG